MIYPAKNLKNTLFLDIETVSAHKDYSELNDQFKKLWLKKAISADKNLNTEVPEAVANSYVRRAGIYSEFSKVVCISAGFLTDDGKLRLKSFAGHNEKKLLQDFAALLSTFYPDATSSFLCGHNIKEFDVPFLCRRMVKHGLPLPKIMDVAGKKPWQTEQFIDTLELWRFGDIKNYTSLELLAATLDIESPKDDIDGSMVGITYWEQNDLNRIVTYCQKDVVTVVQLMLKFCSMTALPAEAIDIVDP
ncbi:MAG: ribonuclease H-like domain-containing protein [Saprospiraceae bacterium]|nr:ribonuclease H-like domain-containing protein [Saprospiraceae bacterium]